MTTAPRIPQPQPTEQTQTILDRAEVYRHLPGMLSAAQYNKRETKALGNAVRVLEICRWYMPTADRLLITSEDWEEKKAQYTVTSSAGCNCPAGRPCLIRGRRRKCDACLDYLAGDLDYRQNRARPCASAQPCKHRGAFELCRRALDARRAAAARADAATKQAAAPTQTADQYATTIALCDELF